MCYMNNSYPKQNLDQQIRDFNNRKAHVTENSELRLTKRGKVVVAVGAIGLSAAALLGITKATAPTPEIAHTYSSTIQHGGNLIQAAQQIEEENNLDFNTTEVGQMAGTDLNGKPAQAGDKLVVSTDADGKVVTERVDTVAEQRANQ